MSAIEKELLKKALINLKTGCKELEKIDLGITRKALLNLNNVLAQVNTPLKIMVMGDFSTGKSTFINAIMGEEVAIVDATPTTAVITKLCYGARNKILVHYINGMVKEFQADSFKHLTVKTDLDVKHDEIEFVERQLPLDILQHITIFDSPGLNDVNERNSDTTKKFVNNSDTVFWMFSVLKPVTKAEVDVMRTLTPRLKPIAIINKMDTVDEEEEDPKELLENLRVLLINDVQAIVGISAKYAFEGKLENNKSKTEIGNLNELEEIIRTLVLPNRNKFKLNSLMDELGEWLFDYLFDIKEIQKHNENNRDIDYQNYLEIKTKVQHIHEVLNRMFDSVIKIAIEEINSSNVQALYLIGLACYYGINVSENKPKGLEYLKSAALNNHTLSQAALGGLYYLDENLEQARYWAEKAALQNDKLSLALLGLLHITGSEVGRFRYDPESCGKAFSLIKKSADLGNSEAQLVLSTFLNAGLGTDKDEKQGMAELLKAVNQGNIEAISELGRIKLEHFKQSNILEDLNIAKENLKKAAYYGDVDAMYHLGEIEWENRRISEAFKWYKKAALLGNSFSQAMIGKIYFEEEGYKDEAQAVAWTTKAAIQGNADAQFNIGYCYQNGIGVSKNLSEAFDWYKKAAEQGLVRAQANLGAFFYYGEGVKQDYYQAFIWFSKAAEQGDFDAQCSLGYCYHEGYGTMQDYHKALFWYEKAANQGDPEAQTRLGNCYFNGEGIGQDFRQAAEWYKKASEQGHATALNNLAYCYQEGYGVEIDYDKAVEYYLKAAKQGNEMAKKNLGLLVNSGKKMKSDPPTKGLGCILPILMFLCIICIFYLF